MDAYVRKHPANWVNQKHQLEEQMRLLTQADEDLPSGRPGHRPYHHDWVRTGDWK